MDAFSGEYQTQNQTADIEQAMETHLEYFIPILTCFRSIQNSLKFINSELLELHAMVELAQSLEDENSV